MRPSTDHGDRNTFPPWLAVSAKITISYLVVGLLWIAVSDEILAAVVSDPTTLTLIQSIKGWFYVIATGCMLFMLLKRHLVAQERAGREMERMASFPRLNPIPIIEVDSSGAITYYNDAARKAVRGVGSAEDVRRLLPGDLPEILGSFPLEKPEHFYREVKLEDRTYGEEIHLVPQFDAARIYAADITTRKAVEHEREAQARQWHSMMEAFSEGITLADATGLFKLYNSHMELITGYSKEEANAAPDFSALLYPQEPDYRRMGEAIDSLLLNGKPKEMETAIHCKNDLVKTMLVSHLRVLFNGQEMILSSYRDITDRKRIEESIIASLHEKDVLLKEVHHRVRNNLQIISSFLNLQAERLEEGKLASFFRVSQNRVKSMAIVHEGLYQSRDLSSINFSEYLQRLTSGLVQTCAIDASRIKVNVLCDEIFLGVDTAIPCGLIANELVSNALKHAFPDGRKGSVEVRFRRVGNNGFELRVTDDGIGFEGEKLTNSTPPHGLGLDIVKTLSRQLNGTLQCDGARGITYIMTFSKPARGTPVDIE